MRMSAMTIVALSSAVPLLPLRESADAEAAECEREEEEQSAPVGDDESDLEPGGFVELVWKVVPVLEAVEPFAGEPHQDQAWEGDEQEREVAEPKQPGLASREQERGGAREQGAEDDGRADEVQQEREALVVGPDGGEQLRHRASRSCR